MPSSRSAAGGVWRIETPHPLLAALLSTGGELLFAGDPEGNFLALNARTGERLWNSRRARVTAAGRFPTP